MEEQEEIQANPFFTILKSLHTSLYKEASTNKYTICVPQGSSLGAVQMNEEFCRVHILHNSKYFKSEYNTLMGQCVELKDRRLVTKTGFDEPRTVNILFEELHYNENYESFSVFCISAPLYGRIEQPKNRVTRRHTCIGLRSENEWVEIFKKQFTTNVANQILNRLQIFADGYNKSYIMVKGFTEPAGQKVIEELRNIPEILEIDEGVRDEINVGLETYVVAKIHMKVMNNLTKHFQKKDRLFYKMCQKMSNISPTDLDIPEELVCDLTEPINTICSINNKTNPVSKLYCIFETCQYITSNVTKNGEGIVLAADDMIPLFTYVLILAQLSHLHSNLEYLLYFHTPRHSSARLDYAFATFQGSIQYILKDISIKHGANPQSSHRRKTVGVRSRVSSQAVSRPSKRNSQRYRVRRTNSARNVSVPHKNPHPVSRNKSISVQRRHTKFETVEHDPLSSSAPGGFLPFNELEE